MCIYKLGNSFQIKTNFSKIKYYVALKLSQNIIKIHWIIAEDIKNENDFLKIAIFAAHPGISKFIWSFHMSIN